MRTSSKKFDEFILKNYSTYFLMMASTFSKIQQNKTFTPPASWLQLSCIDMHTGGEPLRVITGGYPNINAESVLEYRRIFRDQYDYLRKLLMHEPRGHADMYGCILVPPNDAGADFGVVFMHNEGYSTMCGHAIIAIAKLAVTMGWVNSTELSIDAPCGRIKAFVDVHDGKVGQVRFHGVPSFVVATNQEVSLPGLGRIRYDLAYGGAFYAYVEAAQLGLRLEASEFSQLIEYGRKIKQAVIDSQQTIEHPFEADLSFLYGTIFMGAPHTPDLSKQKRQADSRNVCVFADGEVDRSPTGSGVSGRMALHTHQGTIQMGEQMIIESIVGSQFAGRPLEMVDYGPYQAVIPEVSGTAYITGQHEFLLDPEDPFSEGFFLR